VSKNVQNKVADMVVKEWSVRVDNALQAEKLKGEKEQQGNFSPLTLSPHRLGSLRRRT
jgi:hypothetical protein